MLRRLGFRAMLAGISLAATASAYEGPLYSPGQWMSGQGAVAKSGQTPVAVDSNVMPVSHRTNCNFDAVGAWDEANARRHHQPISKRLRGAQTMGNNACGCDDANGPCDFKACSPWSEWDFEKRFIAAFIFRNAHGGATQAAYGDSWGAQFGVEWLPWVLVDGSDRYSRMGFTTLFEYSNFEGGGSTTLQSIQTRNFITIGDGVSYSFILGPTYRCDFDLFGVRVSPSVTAGVDFEWTTLRERQPTNFVIRRVNEFKYSGFDAGFYSRLMWDFGITDYLTIGVGMDFKYVPTDVMVRHDEARKHTAVVLQITHSF